MKKEINTAILGFGFSGQTFHYPFLSTSKNYNICSIMSSQKEFINNLNPSIKVVSSIEEIIHDKTIDLVINCLPNKFHFSHSKKVLDVGKHLVLEKPMANTIAEANELLQASLDVSSKASLFHNRRWDADFQTLKNIISKDELGDVKVFESRFDRFKPQPSGNWREEDTPGSGVFFDLAPHLIDQAYNLFGLPESVFADIETQRPGVKSDDYFHITLFYKEMRAILRAGCLIDHKTKRFEVFGSKASFCSEELDPQENLLKQGIYPGHDQWKEGLSTFYSKVKGKKIPNISKGYMGFYDELATSILDNKLVPVPFSEGLSVFKIMNACMKSNKSRHAVKPV